MSSRKIIMISLIVELIKKTSLHKLVIFRNHFYVVKKLKVELNLPNYATKSDLESATDVIHPNLLKGLI